MRKWAKKNDQKFFEGHTRRGVSGGGAKALRRPRGTREKVAKKSSGQKKKKKRGCGKANHPEDEVSTLT